MRENDYIAEYVKEEYPELLQSVEYEAWKIKRILKECANHFADAIKIIDFSKLNEAISKLNESIKNQEENTPIFEKSIEELKTAEKPVNKGNGEEKGDAI